MPTHSSSAASSASGGGPMPTSPTTLDPQKTADAGTDCLCYDCGGTGQSPNPLKYFMDGTVDPDQPNCLEFAGQYRCVICRLHCVLRSKKEFQESDNLVR